jgi:membrane protease YdiL (CAAX protease family)
LALRILIVAGTVVIVPLFEELLFRGLIQTMIRSVLSEIGKPVWMAIALSSVLFAIMHEEPGHYPALFILGATMGYAYEKSGSLLRPIFIHSIFNGVMLAATLTK